MFIFEIFGEIFHQLRSKSTINFKEEIDKQNIYFIRRSSKDYKGYKSTQRTVAKSKSLKNSRRKGYNWLINFDSIMSNFKVSKENFLIIKQNVVSTLYVIYIFRTVMICKPCFIIE